MDVFLPVACRRTNDPGKGSMTYGSRKSFKDAVKGMVSLKTMVSLKGMVSPDDHQQQSFERLLREAISAFAKGLKVSLNVLPKAPCMF